MTAEFGLRQPQPYETKIQLVVDQEDRPKKIGHRLATMLDLATGTKGLKQINGNYEDYDLTGVNPPTKYLPGYIRTGLFEDKLLVRTMSLDKELGKRVHNLLIPTDGLVEARYNVTNLYDFYDQRLSEDIIGIEEMALTPHASDDISAITKAYEIVAANGWGYAPLSKGDLKPSPKLRSVQ